MRKTIVVAVLLFVVVAMGASAWGIGAAIGIAPIGGLPGSNVLLSIMPPKVPILFGVGFTIGQAQFAMGITADWWMVNTNLFSFVNLYLGPGLYLGIEGSNITFGGRVPIGLNIFPIKWLELFLEIAPVLAIEFTDPITFPVFDLQGAFGLRFWFN